MGRVRVKLDPDVFRLLLTEGHETHTRCARGLPVDAKFISLARDPDTHDFVLFFWAEEFPEVASGATVPWLDVGWEASDG